MGQHAGVLDGERERQPQQHSSLQRLLVKVHSGKPGRVPAVLQQLTQRHSGSARRVSLSSGQQGARHVKGPLWTHATKSKLHFDRNSPVNNGSLGKKKK